VDVRRVGVSDWRIVRDLRLRSLADAPEAFGSSYEREAAFADSVWIDRVGATANATLVCEIDAQACGIVALIRDARDRRMGWVVAMWVAPSVRGTGVADALLVSLFQWANDHGISTVRLHVADGNARAEHLYRRHGFRRTGETVAGERRGLVEVEMQRATLPRQR
jgi:GNAT superfamily N-acetyltransferase